MWYIVWESKKCLVLFCRTALLKVPFLNKALFYNLFDDCCRYCTRKDKKERDTFTELLFRALASYFVAFCAFLFLSPFLFFLSSLSSFSFSASCMDRLKKAVKEHFLHHLPFSLPPVCTGCLNFTLSLPYIHTLEHIGWARPQSMSGFFLGHPVLVVHPAQGVAGTIFHLLIPQSGQK